MHRIGIEEIHKRLLGIATIFDGICRKHQISYYMLGGTMLGAIRHKGFIPWDDDMDFGVPRKDYQQLIEILRTELPAPYQCCTYDSHQAILYPFLKIADGNTTILDPRVNLPIEKQLGVNIDVFPLECCTAHDARLRFIRLLSRLNSIVYVKSSSDSRIIQSIKKFLSNVFPASNRSLLYLQESIASKIPHGDYLANLYGRWGMREVIPMSWYGNGCKYSFEDIELCGVCDYHNYLQCLYGDYMQLPPSHKRCTHVDNVFEVKGYREL